MKMSISPTALLDPRLAFVAFLVVFFAPVVRGTQLPYLLILACGTAYFFAGALSASPARPSPWPTLRPNPVLLAAIFAYKLYSFAAALEFDFSPESLIAALLLSAISQKENVAASVLVGTVVYLLFWHNLLGLCQRGRPRLALALLLAFQLLSLQTGRFLLVSQLGLLLLIHLDMRGRRLNALLVAGMITAIAALFPLLHALRSGDFNSDVDIYSAEYIADIMTADASPGRNFIELAEHVDASGYNYGRYLAYLPLQAIPRFLWGEKPVTSLQSDYTEEIYGLHPLEGVTFTFTIFDSYTILGATSLALMSFLWGLAFMALYRAFLRSSDPYLRIQFALLLVNSFNFFRGNVLDFAAPIVLSLLTAAGLDALRRVRAAAHASRSARRRAWRAAMLPPTGLQAGGAGGVL